MAVDWYLMKTPIMTSGDEGEILDEFGDAAIDDLLDSPLADDLELYNCDLSECTKFRAVVNDKVADTKLKTLNRQFVTKIGTCKAGQYVKYKGRFWLIVGLVGDNHIYEKIIMTICNYQLAWLNDAGRVVQRWANITSASQYNNGETSTMYYYLRTDQLMVWLPDDDESLLLSSGKRFVIDNRTKIYERNFGPDVEVDTSKPIITYELTRADSVLYSYENSGHFQMLVTQDEQHKQDGYRVIDGVGYWLCDIPGEKLDDGPLDCTICYDSLDIYNDLEPGYFTAAFYDIWGAPCDVKPVWEISCDFRDELVVEELDNVIAISVSNNKLIGKTFTLTLSGEGYEPVSVTVAISSFI